jgi:peptidyl-prolyl cis-trans isomerase SurA
MPSMNRARQVFVATFLVALATTDLGAQAPPPQSKSSIIERIIVKVNGEILTQSEIERMQIDALQDQNRRQINPRDLATDAKLMAALADVTPRLLVDEVDNLLLVQHGRELNIKFTEENFKLAIENVKKQNKIENDKQFAQALADAGMTMDSLRQNFERTWIIQQVERREIMKNVTLTEEEARQYYKANPDQFMKPPTVTVREILVAVPTETVGGQQTVNVAKDDEAKQKMTSLRERALKGEDFAKLVEESSEAGTKANGGLIGPILTEELNPAIAGVLEKLKPGEVSDVIRTSRGYQIFKMETRTAAEVEAFDKVRSQLAQRIYESRLGKERIKFLDRLRVQAVMEWKDDAYRKMYEQGAAQRAKSG